MFNENNNSNVKLQRLSISNFRSSVYTYKSFRYCALISKPFFLHRMYGRSLQELFRVVAMTTLFFSVYQRVPFIEVVRENTETTD